MIIYGYRNRSITLATGQFECPRCQMTHSYEHVNIVRFFTLFFIPLFPLGRVSSYVECKNCRSSFRPEDLIGSPGNELFTQELQARNAASEVQAKERRGCVTAVLGVILGVAGGLGLVALTVFQLFGESSPTNNLVGYFGLLCLCPLPLLAAGLGLLIWGARIRQKAGEPAAPAQ